MPIARRSGSGSRDGISSVSAPARGALGDSTASAAKTRKPVRMVGRPLMAIDTTSALTRNRSEANAATGRPYQYDATTKTRSTDAR